MALTKRTYTDEVTVITAENLNDIQDNIIENEKHVVYYGTSGTTGTTQTKAVNISQITVLRSGINVRVKFTEAQEYDGMPKLNISSIGARDIYRSKDVPAELGEWGAGDVVDFVYDSTNTRFYIVNGGFRNSLTQLVQESAFEIVDDNGTLKLYWYGAQAECPYTIVYENGVYNLYFTYTTA